MTDSTHCFDRLTRLAAKALDVAAARICLDEEHRHLIGAARDAICERALAGDDPAVLTAPLVIGGKNAGVLVAAGESGRTWSQAERDLLELFARTTSAELELEIALREAESRRPRVPDARKRILVAEDDDSMRRLMVRELEPDGYSIALAGNGREALDIARGEDVDLLVLDLVMPDLSGWDVLEHRATDPRLHAIPAIIVSARRGPDVARAVAFGVYGLLPKPFEPNDLRDMVRTCFAER
jgi:CheY-like chemotaxis protein